ncbi:RidA family protein [Lacihabitans soyangensis]|uniref:RidA family protein n=1 Tax=Lacihabitans soyangensis TaxID=869394 RepID=A0AAE3H3W5_9BACT|nr:RidA family protein [Lacihabitans soyangensis]MCP9763559.1 RidA family protein [Lacihabitans soyangensis]
MKQLIISLLVFFIAQSVFSQKIEKRLTELNIVLPKVQPPIASYVNAVRTGNLIFLSGKGPTGADGKFITGKVGVDMSLEEGKAAARNTGLNLLAALKAEIGELDKVKRIVKVLGMVNCPSDFTQQPQVINGFSDLMVEVFGDKGRHARSAVGVGSLPANMAVEIEMIVEVE